MKVKFEFVNEELVDRQHFRLEVEGKVFNFPFVTGARIRDAMRPFRVHGEYGVYDVPKGILIASGINV